MHNFRNKQGNDKSMMEFLSSNPELSFLLFTKWKYDFFFLGQNVS